MAETARALSELGAYNVLTSLTDASACAAELRRQGVIFDAHFGGSEVRPRGGHKSYKRIVEAAQVPTTEVPCRRHRRQPNRRTE